MKSIETDDTILTCFFDNQSKTCGETSPKAELSHPVPHCTVSAVLRCGERIVVVLCGERFTVGRSRSCDVIPPKADEHGDSRRRRLRVSRLHCVLFREGAEWTVFDGGLAAEGERRHSSFGTWWNGEQVADSASLGVGHGTLALGGLSALDSVALDILPAGDSLVLSFRQRPEAQYALLSGELDLGLLDKRLSGFRVFCEDGEIRWRRDRKHGHFVPGTRLPAPASDFWTE